MVVLDRSERLERWAEYIELINDRVDRIYTYANNHYAGYAPETIEDLQQRVERRLEWSGNE